MRGSKAESLYKEAVKVIPAGVTRPFRFFDPYPIYVERAKGKWLYDVDGNRYVDYWMGHGALVLGHMHESVVNAVKEMLERGFHFGLCHEWEVKLAKEIVKAVPSAEMVRFTNSGTEANIHAIRLARAYTRRLKVVKITGGWHGVCEPLDVAVSPPFEELESAGIDPNTIKNTISIPFNDVEAAEKVLKGEDVACIVIEPVMGGESIPADPDFLRCLRELCDETGTLLVFDEVITGFRLALGGAQEVYGVKPDLTTLGKAVGGGEVPVGALCGREDVMELMDHLKHPGKSNHVKQGGTYSANPLATRLGYEALKVYEKGEVYKHINWLGDKARKELEEILNGLKVPVYVTGMGSMFKIHFTKVKPKNAKEAANKWDPRVESEFFRFLISKGILAMTQSNVHFYVSLPHEKEDIEKLLATVEEFVRWKGWAG